MLEQRITYFLSTWLISRNIKRYFHSCFVQCKYILFMLQNCYYSDYVGHCMNYVVSVWVSGILLQQKHLLTLWREIYNKPITYNCIIYNTFFSNYEKVNKWIIQLFPKQDILSCLLLKNPNNCYNSLHKKALLLYICLQIKRSCLGI